MPLGPLPSPGPFGRIVDVRVWPHGFTTRQTATAAGPDGSAIVRPNLEDASWHAAGSQKWGGNIVWTGSTPRHTIAYNGPRGRYFGTLTAGSFVAMATWFSHNGVKVNGPSGRVLAACVKIYDDLPTSQTYAGTGTGTLEVQAPSTASGALTGNYEVRCIESAPVPRFLITGPDAQPVGVAEAGPVLGAPVLFDGVVRFTLQAGAIAFVVGDTWTLTVEEAEQFVVITTPAVNSTPQTEKVWRRGVSLTPGSSWRQLATIAPVSGQVDGSIQPWFFNSSATRAVTCRGLGEDGAGFTAGVVGRSLNLATLAVTDTTETSTPLTYTETRVVNAVAPPGRINAGDASDVTFTNTTPSTAPVAQLMALDYDADTLARVEIEVSGSCTGTSHMWVEPTNPDWFGSGDFNDNQHETRLSGGYWAKADVVWTVGGTEVLRLESFSISGSGTLTETWYVGDDTDQAHVGETFSHQILLDVAGPRAATTAFTSYGGSQSLDWDVADTGGHYQVASGVQIKHLVGGTEVSTISGGSGPHAVDPGFTYWSMMRRWPGYEGESGPPYTGSVIGVRALASTWRIGRSVSSVGPLENAAVAVTANTLPTANTSTGRGLQTSAQDTRGNWLMAAELAAFGTSDMRWPGSIGASGTYTTQAGGPDALTPSLVATLTGYPPHDRWNIGAF